MLKAVSQQLKGHFTLWKKTLIQKAYCVYYCILKERFPDPVAGGKEAGCPFFENPTPALGPLGLGLRPIGSRR